MGAKRLSVLVDDEHIPRMADVRADLVRAGLAVENTLDEIGVIVGSIDEGRIAFLQNVHGIASVEVERSVGVAPPDSTLQ